MTDSCNHEAFEASVNVVRLTDVDDGPVTGYMADISVKCAGCGQAFGFVGVPGGYDPQRPMVSFDHCELRAPITPAVNLLDS